MAAACHNVHISHTVKIRCFNQIKKLLPVLAPEQSRYNLDQLILIEWLTKTFAPGAISIIKANMGSVDGPQKITQPPRKNAAKCCHVQNKIYSCTRNNNLLYLPSAVPQNVVFVRQDRSTLCTHCIARRQKTAISNGKYKEKTLL
jgi:hypothetical protein